MDKEKGKEGVCQDSGENDAKNSKKEERLGTDESEEINMDTAIPGDATVLSKDQSESHVTDGTQDKTEGCQGAPGSGTNQEEMSDTAVEHVEEAAGSANEDNPQKTETQLAESRELETNQGEIESENNSSPATTSETNEDTDELTEGASDTTDHADAVVEPLSNPSMETNVDAPRDKSMPESSSTSASKEPSTTCDQLTIASNKEESANTSEKASVERQKKSDRDTNAEGNTSLTDSVNIVTDTNNAGSDTTQDKEKDGPSSGLEDWVVVSAENSGTPVNLDEGQDNQDDSGASKLDQVQNSDFHPKEDPTEDPQNDDVHVHSPSSGEKLKMSDKEDPTELKGHKSSDSNVDTGKDETTKENGKDETTKEKGEDETTKEKGEDETTKEKGEDETTKEKGEDETTKEKGEDEMTKSTGREDPTLTPTTQGVKSGTKHQEGKEDPQSEGGAEEDIDEEKRRAKENEQNEAKANEEGAKGDGTKEEEENDQSIIKERPVSISLCTSAYGFNVEGLVSYLEGLMKTHPELIKAVKIHQLPYNDLDHYTFPLEDPVDVMILCHSIHNRRFAITDVMDALYDEYLPYCARVIGKAKTGVIVHDFDDMRETVQSSRMSSFEYKQPKAFKTTSLQITCGPIEKEEQVVKKMQEPDKEKLFKFLKNASTYPEKLMDISREGDLKTSQQIWKGMVEIKDKAYSYFSEGSSVDPDEAVPEAPGTFDRADVQKNNGSQTTKRWGNERPSSIQNPKRTCSPRKDPPGGSQAANARTGDTRKIPDETNTKPPPDDTLIRQQMFGIPNAPHTQGLTSHQSPSQSSAMSSTPAQKRSNTTPASDPRRISVSICSSAYEHNVEGLMSCFTNLQTKQPHMIKDVRFRELPYNDIDSFKFPPNEPEVDVMVLCHSVQNRGFSITDVMNSLYNKYLKYCHDVIGRKKLAVIVHDFTDWKPETVDIKMESFRRLQPSTFKLVDTVIICGSLEVPCKLDIRDTDLTKLIIFLEKARFEAKEHSTATQSYFGNFNIGKGLFNF